MPVNPKIKTLKTFTYHRVDKENLEIRKRLDEIVDKVNHKYQPKTSVELAEAILVDYWQGELRSSENGVKDEQIAFKWQDTFEMKSPDIKIIRFFQEYEGVPVYASLSVVELDQNDQLISIKSTIAYNIEVSATPQINQKDIKTEIEKRENISFRNDIGLNLSPYFYYDTKKPQWRLVYITNAQFEAPLSCSRFLDAVDYITDANSGEIISKLPRVRSTFR